MCCSYDQGQIVANRCWNIWIISFYLHILFVRNSQGGRAQKDEKKVMRAILCALLCFKICMFRTLPMTVTPRVLDTNKEERSGCLECDTEGRFSVDNVDDCRTVPTYGNNGMHLTPSARIMRPSSNSNQHAGGTSRAPHFIRN